MLTKTVSGLYRLFVQSLLILVCILFCTLPVHASNNKATIQALYIPLADHYAALVAYERYRDEMIHADFQIEQMRSWNLLRAYFQSGKADMAYVMSPLAMNMYQEKPHFRWIGLMHRDGNALAINDLLEKKVQLPLLRKDRKPDAKVAEVLKEIYRETNKPTEIGTPHLLSTHAVVLYRYLKEYGANLSISSNVPSEALAIAVAPSKSPSFINSKNSRSLPAAIEQSLPWVDIVQTEGYGHVAWYSKDVMPWQHGHVECIVLVTDQAIADKFEAIKEVMAYIHKAGQDIEQARLAGGEALEAIVKIVRKHIPAHTRKVIIASLDPHLRAINYEQLNVDKAGLKQIMDLAIEGGILQAPIDIEAFADNRFDMPENETLLQQTIE